MLLPCLKSLLTGQCPNSSSGQTNTSPTGPLKSNRALSCATVIHIQLHNMLKVLLSITLHFTSQFWFIVLWYPENPFSCFSVYILSHYWKGQKKGHILLYLDNLFNTFLLKSHIYLQKQTNHWLIDSLKGI